ncbi:MAG: ATP-binding cassette domain-containing protein, partial [Thermoplasmata archaeon]|nr:ATP-binding cassette domain-containing protein [Thermoplasmata archaeon]
LRALNGLVPRYHGGRYRGHVEVDGLSGSEGPTSQLAAKVGLVFQDPERQSVMSRVDNEVAFGLECLGVPSDEIGPRVIEALTSVGLEGRASDMVSQLSSGQAQRLALADVLAMEPLVLALDEPTSQLDPEAAEEFLRYLDLERRKTGTTVLLAEQRLDRGLQLADRVVVLSRGRVVFDGTPSEFMNDGWSGDEEIPTPTLVEVFREHGPVPKSPEEAGPMLRDLLDRGMLELDGDGEPSPGRTLVRCEDLHFSYQPGTEVLRGADLDIRAGEVLVLVGPNGSGKTTLARHLNGLLRPSTGRVLIDGEDASEMPVARLSGEVALLTQNPGDYLFERTVDRELRLSAAYRGLEGLEANEEIARIQDRLGLWPYMDRFSWDLSAGQRQRVALGALMVGAPLVMVLDEPTRGMDTSHKASLARILRELAAEGKAIMVITHDQEFAARAGDRYAVLEDGRMTLTGAPWEAFLERPAYAPILWRATEGMDLAPEQRPLVPQDLVISGTGIRGGGAW